MTSLRRNVGALTTIALAMACGALAILWPHWRAELGAASYYGYGTPIGVAAPQALASGQVNVSYFQPITIARGTPTSVTVVAGTKPPGINLIIDSTSASTGLTISNSRSRQAIKVTSVSSVIATGTPTQAGTFLFTILVTDDLGSILGRIKITICPAAIVQPFICDTALLEGEANIAYNDSVTAVGGTPPYAFSLVGRATLPPPLQLNGNGAVNGTPGSTARTKKFTVQVADGTSQTFSAPLSLTMLKPPTIAGGLRRAKVGVSYSATLKTRNGLAPIVWTATGLPAGLTIDASTGEVSGVPQTAGKFAINFEATDALTGKGSKTVNLVVGQ